MMPCDFNWEAYVGLILANLPTPLPHCTIRVHKLAKICIVCCRANKWNFDVWSWLRSTLILSLLKQAFNRICQNYLTAHLELVATGLLLRLCIQKVSNLTVSVNISVNIAHFSLSLLTVSCTCGAVDSLATACAWMRLTRVYSEWRWLNGVVSRLLWRYLYTTAGVISAVCRTTKSSWLNKT